MGIVILKCHNCGTEHDFGTLPKEFVCKNCGAVNVVPPVEAYDDPLGCLAPTGFEWQLPAGRMEDAMGRVWYTTAQGTRMTREEYLETFKLDPEIAMRYMRSHRGVRFGGR